MPVACMLHESSCCAGAASSARSLNDRDESSVRNLVAAARAARRRQSHAVFFFRSPVAPTAAALRAEAVVDEANHLQFQASPQDPVLRQAADATPLAPYAERLPTRPASRIALLAGVLPEDEPGLQSGFQGGLQRQDRSVFRAPEQLEGGFVPMVPGAPQIVGPIPSGYTEVVRGQPVQLDLPRDDRPTDFLQDTRQRQPVHPAFQLYALQQQLPTRPRQG